MKRLLIILSATAALTVSATPVFAHHAVGDHNCDDFNSQADAQAYFRSQGGSPSNNVDDLDRDNDGVACEDHTTYPSDARDETPATGTAPAAGAPAAAVPAPAANTAIEQPLPLFVPVAVLGVLLGSTLLFRRITR